CYTYARDVDAGRTVACKKVKLACRRFLRDLDRQIDPTYPWRFDETKAERPSAFMEQFLVPTKGAYDRMTLLPWQCFVLGNLYGWVDKESGLRRYREALIIVGTGNGKSTMESGNATFGACKDGERGADIYMLANSKEQAGIVFNECREQIRASKYLAPRFRPLRDGVYYDAMNSSIKSRASDSERLDGLNPHMAIFDEIKELRDFKLINVIKRKIVKRAQPLIIYITTMGNVIDGPLAYFYDLFTDAMEGKLSPTVADHMFAYIAELDDSDDVNDISTWIKANPSLGVLLKMEDLIDQWERCKMIPSERADFICKQLNITVNTDDMQYVQPEVTMRNKASINEDALLGRRCYGGFDLSNREDFTAAALEFLLDDGRIFVLLHSWVPRRKVELDQEKIDYYGLAMQGYLSIVDGEYIQQEDVYNWFVEQGKKYEIMSIGYDPANATRLRQMLENKGYDCVVVRQGPLTLNDPMKDIKERLMSGSVVSNGDPMLLWYTDNVRLSGERRHTEKQNWMPTKRNKFRKIDGFMAWLCAHAITMDKNPAGEIQHIPSVRVVNVSKRQRTMR
ncbi:MAG: terminase TerL endonuclease subunit, partial [Comamonas sp.]|uniref:terminase large subunit n=1 Tax=Comamonas sp. TaxID=34028 RepID=UPI002FC9D4BB